jgi:glucose/arabinose dehydrogenase
MRRNFITTCTLTAVSCAFALTQFASAQAVKLTLVENGFTQPLYVCAPPGDTARLFVMEKAGIIKIFTGGNTLGTPFLNIDPLVNSVASERGLLGMAFHPNYASNGFFFVSYTDNAGSSVVARYTVSGNPDIGDAASAVIIYGPLAQPQSNHNGGCIQFGPDGKLYFGLGDGGNSNDTGTGHVAGGNAQSLATDLGKMLRFDVDIASPYQPVNPLGGFKWAMGVRNPWRFSFDRSTGDLWIADVGQNAWEEINFTPAASTGGENYGWRCMEGNHCTALSGCTCDTSGATLEIPVQEYSHGGGNCSITGGYVYRGSSIPGLQGTYFYGDFCTGRSWSFELVAGVVTDFVERTSQLGALSGVASFGEDASGEMYICEMNTGEVSRIENADPPGTGFCFGDGSLPTACPCALPNTVPNPSGASDAGCANSFNANGAKITGEGTVSPNDTVVLTGSGQTPAGFCLFVVGTGNNPSGVANADGVLCLDGAITRFGSQYPVGGVSTYPNVSQPTPLSTVSGTTVGSGQTRYYQIFYRNSVVGFCNAATANWTSAYQITWN